MIDVFFGRNNFLVDNFGTGNAVVLTRRVLSSVLKCSCIYQTNSSHLPLLTLLGGAVEILSSMSSKRPMSVAI